MGYFYDTYMAQRRQQFLRSIHSVEALADGVWHRGEINLKEVKDETLEIKATLPTLDAVACTITATRIVDVRGEVAAYQARKITKNAGQGVMIKITVPIYEVTP